MLPFTHSLTLGGHAIKIPSTDTHGSVDFSLTIHSKTGFPQPASTGPQRSMSTIQEFFTGKTVLVTGATGFLGKAIIEKILRSLPDLRQMYLLIRPKERGSRSVPADRRFYDELLKSSIFNRLRRELGEKFDEYVTDRVRVVAGDLTDERFGASEDDYRRLTQEVQVIFNSAAVVVFDERLDLSLNLNTQGARRMMDFARLCPRVEAVVHISTCYVSGMAEGRIEEVVPPLPFDVDAEVAGLERACTELEERYGSQPTSLKDKLVALGLERARARGWHDTYTFTKALGEQLILKYRGDVPMAIVRPSIIESTFAEPEPGWIDGFRMADPLFVGCGKGYLKDFPGRPDSIIDFIPCDHVVNAILAAAPRCAADRGLTVYQVASGEENPIQFRTSYEICRDHFTQTPMRERDGSPIAVKQWTFPEARTYRRFLNRHYRWPALIAETFLRPLSFLKPLDKARRRLALRRAGLEMLLYYVDIYGPYTSMNSRFVTGNTRGLWASLSPEEQVLFPFDVGGIDWHDYIGNIHIPGLKRNVLNLEVPGLEEGHGVAVRTIPGLLSRSADRFPDAVALQIKRGGQWARITYDELERKVQEACVALARAHVTQGDAVLLYAENMPEWGIAYLAAASLGAVVAPTDRQLGEHDVLAAADFVQAKAILVSETSYLVFSEKTRRDDAVLRFLNIQQGCQPFPGTRAAALAERAPAHPPSTPVSPDDVASIIFTTGAGGSDPRAVMLTHRNFLSNVMGVVQFLPPRPTDNFLSLLPLHHALEFTGGLLVPLYVGATVTYCESMRSRAVIDAMRETRVSCLIGVPRVFQVLHDAIRRQVAQRGLRARLWFDTMKAISKMVYTLTGRNLGRRFFARVHEQLGGKLRGLISGGAALSPQIHEEFTAMGFELYEGYGLTETAPIATANPLRRAKMGSVGQPLPGVEVRIVDPDERGVGEITVRGPNLTVGYFRNPAATNIAIREGWLHTGDVGYMDHDGYLHLTGRIKDIIVTAAGKNVYPEEVEARYAGLAGVHQLCVVGLWDEKVLGETVHAVVVPERAALRKSIGFEASLRQAIRQRAHGVPSYQRLQHIHLIDQELPRTLSGSIDRHRVKELLFARLAGDQTNMLALESEWDEDSTGEPVAIGVVAPPRPVTTEAGVRTAIPSHAEAVSLAEPVVPYVETQPQPIPVWGKVLVPKGQVDDSRWLHAGLLKRFLRAGTRRFIRLWARAWFSFEVRGTENLPAGAFIVAANHASHLDTAAVVTAFGRRGGDLFVMGARDYFFTTWIRSWFFHTLLNVVPFDRTENMIKGLRLAQSVLRDGKPVLIFPEGTRSLDGTLHAFRPGIGLLGVELGVPIVPCHIEGTFEALPKGRRIPGRVPVRVTFGQPIPMDEYRAQHVHFERRDLYRRVASDVRAAVQWLEREAEA
jgi:long-chain acyl-CoA synthetase